MSRVDRLRDDLANHRPPSAADVHRLLDIADAAEGLLCELLFDDPADPGYRLVPAELLDNLRAAVAPLSDRLNSADEGRAAASDATAPNTRTGDSKHELT